MEWAACEKCAQRCGKKAEIRPAKSVDSSRADGKDRFKKPENERLQKDALIQERNSAIGKKEKISMNKLGKKLKQGIALLLAALMVVTCVPVDSLVVQAAEVQEDTDGKEQEPAAAVTGEEKDAGDAEETEDAAAPVGDETAPADPEETPADPVKGDAAVEEGEGTPDAQTTAPQVEEEIVDGTEASVPSQAAVENGATLTFDAGNTGIELDVSDSGSNLTAKNGEDNVYTIADNATEIKFALTGVKKVVLTVKCVANSDSAEKEMTVSEPVNDGLYTVSLETDANNGSITVNSLKLTVTTTPYEVKTVDSAGTTLDCVTFSSGVTDSSYDGEGPITFKVNPADGKTVESVEWGIGTSKDGATNSITASDSDASYTINENNLTGLAAEKSIYIVVTWKEGGDPVGESITVGLDADALTDAGNLGITSVKGLITSGSEVVLEANATEIQFKLTGAETALQNFKAVNVVGVWGDQTEGNSAVYNEENETYTFSVTDKPNDATRLTLKVVPEKYEVSVSNTDVTATFTGTGVTKDDTTSKYSYNGGKENIVFTLEIDSNLADTKSIGTVTWNTTDEDAKTLTPMNGTYTITSDDIAKAGLGNDDIVISVTLVNIVSVAVKTGTDATIDTTGIENSGLEGNTESGYTIKSGAQAISFKLTGEAVTGMKAVAVTGTWKDEKDENLSSVEATVGKDGVYTIAVADQPTDATTLELSVTTTPYTIVEEKDEGVTINYTAGVKDNTYTGGTDAITFTVGLNNTLNGKRVKDVYWKASTATGDDVLKKPTSSDNNGTETYTIEAVNLQAALKSEDDIVISVVLENIVTVTFATGENKAAFTVKNGLDGDGTQNPYTIQKGAETFTFSLGETNAPDGAPQLNVFASYDGGKIFAEYSSNEYVITVADIPEDVTALTIDYEYSKRKVSLDSDSAKEVNIDYPDLEEGTNGATVDTDGTAYYDGTNDINFTVAAKDPVNKRIKKVSWKQNADATPKDLTAGEDGSYTITKAAIDQANLQPNDSIIICVELEDIIKVTFDKSVILTDALPEDSGLENLTDGVYDVKAGATEIKFTVDADSLRNIKNHTISAVYGDGAEDKLDATPAENTYTIDLTNLPKGKTALTIKISSIDYYTVSLDAELAESVEFTAKDGIITETDEESGTVTYYYKGGTNDLTFGLAVKDLPYTIDKVTWKKATDGELTDVTFANGTGTIPAKDITLTDGNSIIISATLKRNPIPVNLVGDDEKVSFAEDGTVTKTEDGTFLYDVNGANKNIVLTATKENAAMIKRIEYTAGDMEDTIERGTTEGENTTYTFSIEEGVAAFDDVDSITITVVWREYVDLTIAENEFVDVVDVRQLDNSVPKDTTTGKYNVEANEDIYLTVKLKADAKYTISGLTGDCRVDKTDDTSADGNTTFKFQIRTAATVKVVTKVDSNQANSIVFPDGPYSVTVKDGNKIYTYFGNATEKTHYTLGTELTLAFTLDPGYALKSVAKKAEGSTGSAAYDNDTKKVTFTSADAHETLALTVTTKGEIKITFDDSRLEESTLQFTAQDGVVKDPTVDEDEKTYIVQGSVDKIKFTVNAPAYVTPSASVDGVADAVTRTTAIPESPKEQAYEFTLSTENLTSGSYEVVLSETPDRTVPFQFDIDSTTMEIESFTLNGKEQNVYGSYNQNVRIGSTVVVTVKALENCSLTKTIEAESASAATKNENPLSEGQTSVTLTFSNIGLTTGDKLNMAYGKVEGKENLVLNELTPDVTVDPVPELVKEGNFSYTVEYGTNKTYLASVRKGTNGIATPDSEDYKFELTGDSVKSTAVKDDTNVKVTVSPEDQGKTLTLTMFTETKTTPEGGTETITKNTIGSYTLRVRGKLASLEIEGAKKDAEGVYNFTQLIGSSKDYLLKLSDSDAKAFAKAALTATAYKADGTTVSTGVEANVKNGILNVTAKSVAETETATIKITNSADGANAAVLATVKVTTASPFTDKTKVTAKALTSDDTTLSLNVTAPKAVPDPADGKLYYEVQLTASGTLTGQGSAVGKAYQYFEKTGASQVLNVNAINPGPGLNNGEKCDFTVAVTLVQVNDELTISDDAATRSAKVVLTSPTTDPLAMATRDPWYADKLTVKQKVKTVYTGQQNILIGSISYDKNTSYTGAVAGVIDYQVNGYDDKGELVPTFDDEFKCNVTADGSIYMDVESYASIGKQTLRVYLEMPATDNYTTHFVPYKDLTITVTRGITNLAITGSSGKIYKKDKKAATVKLTAVDSWVGANKTKVTWSVGKGRDEDFRPLAPSDALYKMVTVNSKGQVTVNKNYVVSTISGENEFTVQAKAADYTGEGQGTRVAYQPLTVTTVPQELGDIVIYKYGEVIASGATVAELTADQLNGASVGVLRADVSLDPENFSSSDLVNSNEYTIVSSNKKAVDITSYNSITVSKIANNVKLTATAKDGSGTKKVMTLKKVNYAELGQLGLKITVLGQGGNPEIIPAGESFSFNGTPATKIAVSVMEKQGNSWVPMTLPRANMTKWNISLSGLKDVTNYEKGITANEKKLEKVLVLSKAKGTIKLTGAGKNDKWSCDIVNSAFAGATVKAPAVKNNGVNLTNNKYSDSPLEFTFTGKANAISAVTDTCKYVLVEPDAVKYNAKTSSFYEALYENYNYNFNYDYMYVPLRSDGFTVPVYYDWSEVPAGSYKLQLTYGNINEDNEFQAVTKTAAVTVKVTAAKNTFKLASTYTMSEQDNAVISLTGSGKTVKKVEINRLRGGVVNGQRNQFLNYLELTGDGKIKIKDTLPEGKTFADFGALAKQERVGYVQYTVHYNDGTVDDSRVDRDIWEKITINTKKDLVAVKSYKAVVTGDVLAGDTNATAEMTIQANKVPVKVIHMQPDASNEFNVTLGEDKTTFTLTPKNASLTAGKKTVKLTIIPEDSLYGKTTEIAAANIAKGITVSASVNVKAVTTKGKVSIAANALKQQLRLNAAGDAYEAEIPYTAKVRASIKEVKAFTGAANKLVALEDLKITADENEKILKLSIAKAALVAEKADGKLAWDTTYADSKKVKEAISMTVNFNAAGSVAETFRMTLTTPKNPETFDSIVAAVRECKTNGTLYNVVLSATGYDNDKYLENVRAGIEGVINGIVLKDSDVTPEVNVENYNNNTEVKVTITLTQGENTKVFVVVEKNAFEEATNFWNKIQVRLTTIRREGYKDDLNGDTILSDLRKEFEITSDKTDLRLVKTEEKVTAPTAEYSGSWRATFALYNSRTGEDCSGNGGTLYFTIPQLPTLSTASGKITTALNDVYGSDKATNAVTKEEILSVAAKAVAANEALKVDYKKTSDGQDMFVKVDAKTVHTGSIKGTLIVSDDTEYTETVTFEYTIPMLLKVEKLLENAEAMLKTDILAQYSGVLSEEALKSEIEAVANTEVISGNAGYSFDCTITAFTAPTYNAKGSVECYLTLKEGQEILGMTGSETLTIDAQPELLKLEDVEKNIKDTWENMTYDEAMCIKEDDDMSDHFYGSWSEYVTLSVATRPDPDKDDHDIKQFTKTPITWTAKGKISVILTVSKNGDGESENSESIEVSLERESETTLFEALDAKVKENLNAIKKAELTEANAVATVERAITGAISAVDGLTGVTYVNKLTVDTEAGTINGTIEFTYKANAEDEGNTQTTTINIDLKTPAPSPDPSTDSLAA